MRKALLIQMVNVTKLDDLEIRLLKDFLSKNKQHPEEDIPFDDYLNYLKINNTALYNKLLPESTFWKKETPLTNFLNLFRKAPVFPILKEMKMGKKDHSGTGLSIYRPILPNEHPVLTLSTGQIVTIYKPSNSPNDFLQIWRNEDGVLSREKDHPFDNKKIGRRALQNQMAVELPDGKLVVAGAHDISIFDPHTIVEDVLEVQLYQLHEMGVFNLDEKRVVAMAVQPDGDLVLGIAPALTHRISRTRIPKEEEIVIFNLVTRDVVRRWQAPVCSLATLPDGRIVSANCERYKRHMFSSEEWKGEIVIWNKEGKPLQKWNAPTFFITVLPDRQHLISCGVENNVSMTSIWDLTTGERYCFSDAGNINTLDYFTGVNPRQPLFLILADGSIMKSNEMWKLEQRDAPEITKHLTTSEKWPKVIGTLIAGYAGFISSKELKPPMLDSQVHEEPERPINPPASPLGTLFSDREIKGKSKPEVDPPFFSWQQHAISKLNEQISLFATLDRALHKSLEELKILIVEVKENSSENSGKLTLALSNLKKKIQSQTRYSHPKNKPIYENCLKAVDEINDNLPKAAPTPSAGGP